MSKFVVTCPNCGKKYQVGSGVFSRKTISCLCGKIIDVSSEKLKTMICPNCGQEVMYDASKQNKAICPNCHSHLFSNKEITIDCPSCHKHIKVGETAKTINCPSCGVEIDVQARLYQQEMMGKSALIEWNVGKNNSFVFKYPVENFGFGTQLIVREGQKAIFFRDGRGLDIFGPGRYALEVQNLPLMNKIYNLLTENNNTFSSSVYFIRTNRIHVLWSVPKLTLKDESLGFHIDLGFSGSMELQVQDDDESARKFLLRIVDTTDGSNDESLGKGDLYDASYIENKFRDILVTHLGELFAKIVKENGINILDIDSYKIEISNLLRDKLNIIFDDYGLVIPQYMFSIPNMLIHNSEEVNTWRKQESDRVLIVREQENVNYIAQAARPGKFTEAGTNAGLKIINSTGDSESLKIQSEGEAAAIRNVGHAEAEVMKDKNYTYQQETQRKIGMEAMKNGLPGTGKTGPNNGGGKNVNSDVVGTIIGLGVGLEVAKGVIKETNKVLNGDSKEDDSKNTTSINGTDKWTCPHCGAQDLTTKFCPNCGKERSK